MTTAKNLLQCLLLGWVAGSFAGCTSKPPADTDLELLQGQWVGYMLERNKATGEYAKPSNAQKITLTIKGDSLHFYRDQDFWWDTTFTLPEKAGPAHLHATIKRPESSSGESVIAFYVIDGATLTIGGVRDHASEEAWPKSFDTAKDTMAGRYVLERVVMVGPPIGG